ncbi:MAG: hypothetical protein WCJ29_00560, partial [bacterium]
LTEVVLEVLPEDDDDAFEADEESPELPPEDEVEPDETPDVPPEALLAPDEFPLVPPEAFDELSPEEELVEPLLEELTPEVLPDEDDEVEEMPDVPPEVPLEFPLELEAFPEELSPETFWAEEEDDSSPLEDPELVPFPPSVQSEQAKLASPITIPIKIRFNMVFSIWAVSPAKCPQGTVPKGHLCK